MLCHFQMMLTLFILGVNLTRTTLKFEKLLICWFNWAAILWLFLTFIEIYENAKIFLQTTPIPAGGLNFLCQNSNFWVQIFFILTGTKQKTFIKSLCITWSLPKGFSASYKHPFCVFSDFLSQSWVLTFPAHTYLLWVYFELASVIIIHPTWKVCCICSCLECC